MISIILGIYISKLKRQLKKCESYRQKSKIKRRIKFCILGIISIWVVGIGLISGIVYAGNVQSKNSALAAYKILELKRQAEKEENESEFNFDDPNEYVDSTGKTKDNSGKSESGADTLIKIALAEYQKYKNNTSLHGGHTYWTWANNKGIYGEKEFPWCATFVHYCADQARFLGEGKPFGGTYGAASTTETWNRLGRIGCKQYRFGEYLPVPGDIIFYDNDGNINNRLDHIGIVYYVTEDGHIWTIEGNTGPRRGGGGYKNSIVNVKDRMVNPFKGSRSDLGIYGFVHINYPNTTISGNWSLDSSKSNEWNVFTYLVQKMGMNKAQACGILGNISCESGINPDRHEDKKKYGDGLGEGYGLCQWSFGRKTNVINYCTSRGLDKSSLEGQLDYLASELLGSYKKLVYNSIIKCEDTEEGCRMSAMIWCKYFEVCKNSSDGHGGFGSAAYTRANVSVDAFYNKYKSVDIQSGTITDNGIISGTGVGSTVQSDKTVYIGDSNLIGVYKSNTEFKDAKFFVNSRASSTSVNSVGFNSELSGKDKSIMENISSLTSSDINSVVIMIGTYDLKNSNNTAVYASNMKRLINQIYKINKDAVVKICTIPPVNTSKYSKNTKELKYTDDDVKAINKSIISIAKYYESKGYKIKTIDVYGALVDKETGEMQSSYNVSYYNTNNAGYVKIASLIR